MKALLLIALAIIILPIIMVGFLACIEYAENAGLKDGKEDCL